MAGKHATLSPSASERWLNCPGSVALCAKVPVPPTSEAAAEGTVAHAIAADLLLGKTDEIGIMGRIGSVVEEAGFKIAVTDEMVNAAIEWRDIIVADKKALEAQGKPAPIMLAAETRVQVKGINIGGPIWGTSDAILYQRGNALRVYDFKYGRGVVVDAEENTQMALYCLGVMDTEAGQAFDEVELVIVQPRTANGVRRWKAPIAWLKAFRKDLNDAVFQTTRENAKLVSGSWCRWCPAAAQCRQMVARVQEEAKADFSAIAPTPLPDPRLVPVEMMARALQYEDMINAWYECLRERIRTMLESGQEVPGYKLVEGRVNRRWKDEREVVHALSPILGAEALYERKLLTPAKLEKMVGKGKLEEMGLTEKPPAPHAIAPVSDPRPQVQRTAVEDFMDVTPPKDGEVVTKVWPPNE